MIPERIFTSGQLVYCVSHWGWFFRPPAPGKVWFKVPLRISRPLLGKRDWYFVVSRGGVPVFMPSDCLYDLRWFIEKEERWNSGPPEYRCGDWVRPYSREDFEARERLKARCSAAKQWLLSRSQ